MPNHVLFYGESLSRASVLYYNLYAYVIYIHLWKIYNCASKAEFGLASLLVFVS